MSGGKGVLKWLRQWIQATASRILELQKYRNIKRRISRNIYGGLLPNGSVGLGALPPLFTEEATLRDLIVDRKFEEACDLACRVHGGLIRGYCSVMLSRYVPNSEADGEDIAQQVFLEFWRTLRAGKYEPSKGSIHGFLLTIAERRVIGKLRTPNRIVPGRDTDLSEVDRRNMQDFHARNPELMVLEDEQRKIVHCGIENLSAKERQLLHWRYTLGHSTVKIAEFTGEKRGTIASRISRLCARLLAICNSDD
jgi:RNA polymerase sigma factor (sigma-70 family)